MKRILIAILAIEALCVNILQAQQITLSLDSCRTLAIANNKELLIGNENIKAAHYQHKAAITNYLPKISLMAGYMRNQRQVQLLSDESKGKLEQFGALATSTMGQLTTQAQAIAQQMPQLAPLIQSLSTSIAPLGSAISGLGPGIIDAFSSDTRNMFAGALTLIQPIFMGGKIAAYDKITRYAEQLAESQQATGMEDVILSVDQAYWQVISLVHKQKLAQSYLELLEKLDGDVNKMIENGFATRADGLSIAVKKNEAEMTLTKVEDGLSLAKMLLCQICGIDLTSDLVLADEEEGSLDVMPQEAFFDMQSAYDNRSELKSLTLANKIYKEKINVARAEMLPQISFIGSYLMTNPNVYNGFQNKFKGSWHLGVMLSVPVWNWGESLYKVKQAKAEAAMQQYRYDEAREKIELQVNQSAFKVNEAIKHYNMAVKNMDKAEENLRMANLGFREGMMPASTTLEAHTAWLQAESEKIDAEIDVKLTEIYLQKALGKLNMNY
ncbi:MAG: TolC family protein [Bacteroidaceae bacterium]|nr:TolC family protein [Bacteroidaceae bacterium]MBQ8009636.1 TolC family protein [Bacteroidaceae bacterium]